MIVVIKILLDSHDAKNALKRKKLEKLQNSYTGWKRALRKKIVAIHVRIGWYLAEGHLETEYEQIEMKEDYPSIIHTLELFYFPKFPNFTTEMSKLAKQVLEIETWIYVQKPDFERLLNQCKKNTSCYLVVI